ncbi:MAG: hypothetical protein KME54_25600 [Tolypothrix brevis GSE-NOS-MK-07-07A]|jgi:hypothetical protein|nr:hypothetical protein [Tolypothrix brevis GSE-NOS-MK-07-07A]
MSSKNQAPKVEVVVAVIALAGSLGAALITGVFSNWDKLFPKPTPTSTPNSPVSSPHTPKGTTQPSHISPSPSNPEPTSVHPSHPELPRNPDSPIISPLPESPVLKPGLSSDPTQPQNWCEDPKLSNEDKYRLGCPGF